MVSFKPLGKNKNINDLRYKDAIMTDPYKRSYRKYPASLIVDVIIDTIAIVITLGSIWLIGRALLVHVIL